MDNIPSFTVVSLSYEDARLEFFRAQREAAHRRMEYWQRRIKPTTTPMHPEYHNVTEAAEHWNYYNDIVEMLEAKERAGAYAAWLNETENAKER